VAEPAVRADAVELVIFDCDGVLVDTERLSVRIDGEVLADLGLPMSQQEVIDRFVGRTEDYWQAEVRRMLGREVSAEEFAAYDPWYRAAFEADLTAIDGIAEAIDELVARGVQTCVASSGTHDRMEFTLGHTGLYPRFAGRIFSATQVAEGKPSPLLFQFAAAQMAVEPAGCLVIEDSRYGVQAARSAGMRVIGYSGSVISAEALHEAGATVVIDDMRKIPGLLDTL
jgi:HAD superfamily hydrolase (TIGR01509 family)